MSILSKFSASEQKLIGFAVALCVILGGWQFVIKPISKAKSQSTSQYAAAVRDYDIVQRAIPRLSSEGSQASAKPVFNRAAVINTAQNVSLPISRVQPSADQAVQVWFDAVSSAQVFNFLQTLESQYAVNITNAQINRRKNGLISAQFIFAPVNKAGK